MFNLRRSIQSLGDTKFTSFKIQSASFWRMIFIDQQFNFISWISQWHSTTKEHSGALMGNLNAFEFFCRYKYSRAFHDFLLSPNRPINLTANSGGVSARYME